MPVRVVTAGRTMTDQSEARVALVTGSSAGIGKAVARSLLEDGYRVVLTARGEDRLDAAAEELRDLGEVRAVPADVTDDDSIRALVDEIDDAFGRIDALVNNAGTTGPTEPFEDVTVADWEHVFDVNVYGVVRVTQAALPYLRDGGGVVVNISSDSAIQPDGFMPQYNASKAAINSLTRTLAKDLGEDGIRVNAVSPTLTKTPLVENMFETEAEERGMTAEEVEEEFLEEARPGIVFDRPATPEEIADVVAFLASDEASFVTGSNYHVTGGNVETVDM